jgi:hypothetical protein
VLLKNKVICSLCKYRSKDHKKGGYESYRGDYGEDGSMAPYGNTGGPYGGAYAGGYGGYGTYGAYTVEDGFVTYDLNAEGVYERFLSGPFTWLTFGCVAALPSYRTTDSLHTFKCYYLSVRELFIKIAFFFRKLFIKIAVE